MSQNTHVIPAAVAKNRFGEMLDTAQREPVIIQKHGRTVAVLLSGRDYEEYQRLVGLDDAWWGERAMKVIKRGEFLGAEKSKKYMDSILHAKNRSRK